MELHKIKLEMKRCVLDNITQRTLQEVQLC